MFKKEESVLYHYTDREGYFGIIQSDFLNPSLLEANPRDARHGNGQYLTDIEPGSLTSIQVSKRLFGGSWAIQKVAYYIAVNVKGLAVEKPAKNIYLIRNQDRLDLTGRIVGGGPTQ